MTKRNNKMNSFPKISFSRLNQILFTLREVLKISSKIDAKLLITVLVLNSIWGLTSVPTFYIEKLLIDRLIQGIGNPDIALVLRGIIYLLLLRIGLEFIRNAVSSLSGYLRRILSRKVTNELDVMIGEKVSQLDLATIEDPEFRDRFNKIERESGKRAWGLMMPLSDIPNYVFGFFSSLGLLFLLSPLVVLGVFVFSLPTFFIDRKFIKKDYELHSILSPLYRIWSWLSYYLTQNRNFMEMKILGLSNYLSTRLRSIQKEEMEKRIKLEKEREKSRFFSLFPVIIFDFFVTLWVCYLVILSRITIGSFQMYLRALSNAQQNLTGLVSSFLEVYENYIYVVDLVWFLNLKPSLEGKQNGKIVIDGISKIKFEDVWFKYRKDSKWVIRGVSFEVGKGEKIALVGENGAGKSTIIKLLGRFYDPNKGRIYVNGKDIKDLDILSLREKLAVLFQEFELYPFTAREAIGFGDLKRVNSLPEIKKAAQKAGIDEFIEELPLKYENPIAPELEKGVRPSIGQWQRFGIARMLFRNQAQVLILDEPTSNVDPEAEEKIFLELKRLVKGKILIFVTQRFSTVRIADKIMVLSKGKIVESGNHEALIKKQGVYARMFNIQALGYQ